MYVYFNEPKVNLLDSIKGEHTSGRVS